MTEEPWGTFLARVLPDPQVRSFTQRLLGLALYGDPGDRALPVFVGTGANGKSTLRRAVLTAFGVYTAEVDSGIITSALWRDELIMCTNHPPEIARDDMGLLRRVFVVPFSAVIPRQEMDDRLGARLCEPDARGHVRAWVHEGYRQYAATDLRPPERAQ